MLAVHFHHFIAVHHQLGSAAYNGQILTCWKAVMPGMIDSKCAVRLGAPTSSADELS